MIKAIVVFLCILLAVAASSSRAQVLPSATAHRFSVTAGGLASAFQPDYAGGFVASESPNRLYGAGAFVDVQFSRWLQLEAEGRWLRFNQFVNINQDNYLIGPRLPIHRFGRFTPYGKVLVGFGYMNFEFSEGYGHFTDIAYGGGVDLRVSKKFSVRAFDFEYQQWPKWIYNQEIYPYGGSVGISYKIF